jgi:hypothetical protein
MAVLVTVNYNNSLNMIMPPGSSNWLSQYFQGILIFACFGMFEFVFVNFCSVAYNKLLQEKSDIIESTLKALLKYKKKYFKRVNRSIYIEKLKSPPKPRLQDIIANLTNIQNLRTEANEPLQTEIMQTDAGLMNQSDSHSK